MLCLKKVYTDELLQIAILLSLLRSDRNTNFSYDVPAIGVGINDDLSGWQNTPHLIHRELQVHPKNLDSILLDNYDQHVFDELNSLGRYNRINNVLRRDVQAYLLNIDENGGVVNSTLTADPSEFDSPASSSFSANQTDENLNSGNDADSEGSSDPEHDALEMLVPKTLSAVGDIGDDLTQEDMDLIEVLWKQDVDLGLVAESFGVDENYNCFKPIATTSKNESVKELVKEKLNEIPAASSSSSVPKEDENEINPWAGLSYTIDLETGEYILKQDERSETVVSTAEEPPSASLIDQSDFSLAEALQLVGLNEDTFELPDSEEKLLLDNEVENQKQNEDNTTGFEDIFEPDNRSRKKIKKEEEEAQSENEIRGEIKPEPDFGPASGASSSSFEDNLEDFYDILPEMIQTPQFHSRPFQGRMPFMRTMSTEQRWSDLANLFSPPDVSNYHPYHYHPGSPYPGSPYPGGPSLYHGHAHGSPESASTRNVLLHNATLAPPVGDMNCSAPCTPYSMGNPNLGSAVVSSMNLTNSSEPMGSEPPGASFKMENHDMIYYPNNTSEMNNTTSEGLLLFNDDDFEDLQLMDMAMNEGGIHNQQESIVSHPSTNRSSEAQLSTPHSGNEGMYTMRSLDGGASSLCAEKSADSDSAVSSMGSERVPSLSSDTEWMETNSDSGHTSADHYNEYLSYKCRWADYGYSRQQSGGAAALNHGSSRMQSVAQKKYQMYGKQGSGASPSSMLPHSSMPHVKFEFSGSDGSQAAAGMVSNNSYPVTPSLGMSRTQAEMKYSCSLEFSRQNHGMRTSMEHVAHNHTYHLPPEQAGAMQRPITRDKMKACKRNEEDQHLTRDERKAREHNVPIPVHDIINLPMDEFNERLSKYDLNEAQLTLIRDIRRRGKNKVAAQNCRKRKLDQINNLADQVKHVKEKKHRLKMERECLLAKRQMAQKYVGLLYNHIFQALRDDDGNPYSPYEWSLQQSADGSVVLVPRTNSSSILEQSEPHTSKHTKEPDPDLQKQ